MAKLIFHVDVNNAFLSWTSVKLLSESHDMEDPRLIPSVIGGDEELRHGVVLAKSTPAKKYGIVTGESLMEAKRKCPFIQVYSPDRAWYKKQSDAFYSILLRYSDIVERASIDECFIDMSAFYKEAIETADEIREIIKKELGFTVNVGISDKKVLAKIASDFSKPDKTHTLYSYEIEEKLWPLPVGTLLFAGPATVKKLNSIGINTVGDLALADPKYIESTLKSQGIMLQKYAKGQDNSEVKAKREENKGYSASITMKEDVRTEGDAAEILRSLCDELTERMRSDRKYAKSIAVTIRYSDFITVSHQCTMTKASDISKEIYPYIIKLFREKWNHNPIRLLGIALGNLSNDKFGQYSLFESEEGYEKSKKAEIMADTLKKRFGKNSIKRGI